MTERYLIINADDFGLHESSDHAICELLDAGLLTSATILAPAHHAHEACASAAKQHYPVGVHWTLHSEWQDDPWPPSAHHEQVPSLINSSGHLWTGHAKGRPRTQSHDVTRELLAQYQYLRRHGVKPDHADSHGGSLYGINGRLFFINALRLCRSLGLPFRFPKTDGFLRRQLGRPVPAPLHALRQGIVSLAARMDVPLLDDFITNPYPIAKIPDYEALCRYYEPQLKTAPPGITEVFLHPSLPDPTLCAKTPEWKKREWEYRFLAEGRLLNAAKKAGFTLVSWSIFSELQ